MANVETNPEFLPQISVLGLRGPERESPVLATPEGKEELHHCVRDTRSLGSPGNSSGLKAAKLRPGHLVIAVAPSSGEQPPSASIIIRIEGRAQPPCKKCGSATTHEQA